MNNNTAFIGMSSTKIIVVVGKGDKQKEREIVLHDACPTLAALRQAYAKQYKIDKHRLMFKKSDESRMEDYNKSLSDYGVKSGDRVLLKDLGPQIGYRTVFVVEYAGPLLFVLLYAARPALIFGASASEPMHIVAKLGVLFWSLHFIKREFETFFVHRFSRPTMPLSNLFKNCAYYWCFGLVIGYPLCSPSFVAPPQSHVFVGAAVFVAAEIGNLICHIMLRNMRPAEGSQDRLIPKGFLFNLVACPNYTFEVLSWIGFSVMTGLLFSYLFTAVGFLQMADWAVKKHKGYKKSYGKEYISLNRKAIVPFIY